MKIFWKLWPFLATRDRQNKWRKGAQGIENPSGNGLKKYVFESFLTVFWGPGPVWEPSRLGSRKSVKKVLFLVWILARFRAVLALCGVFLKCFFGEFSGAPILRILEDLVAQG
jgi:hypothetical protein